MPVLTYRHNACQLQVTQKHCRHKRDAVQYCHTVCGNKVHTSGKDHIISVYMPTPHAHQRTNKGVHEELVALSPECHNMPADASHALWLRML